MRYEKSENVLRLAVDMQGTREGLSLQDIEHRYAVSRRTAERMRDAVERLFPQMEQANPGETPKRWRLPAGTLNQIITLTAEDIADVETAAKMMRGQNLTEKADRLGDLANKIRAVLRERDLRRLEPDIGAILEAEGLAMRPGPKPDIDKDVLHTLREAIKGYKKVRLHYRARETGKLSRQIVCPYGFLYGNRHYLVAYNMNSRIRDYRLFSLANIEKVDLTEHTFERREDFSLDDYARNSFGVFQEEPVNVVWRFRADAADDARHHLFHPGQEIEDQQDGSVIVRFRAGGQREMCWELFRWEDAVEVLEPPELKELYQEILGRIVENE